MFEGQEHARGLFRDSDGIVVPRVYRQLTTQRVLTMERLEGVHLTEFLACDPSQQERSAIAEKLLRSWYRMVYQGRMLYADMHRGNYLVLEDGRLGLLDFGFILPFEAVEWELFRKLDKPLTTGKREDIIESIKEWNSIGDNEPDRLRLCFEYAEWCWIASQRALDCLLQLRLAVAAVSAQSPRRHSRHCRGRSPRHRVGPQRICVAAAANHLERLAPPARNRS